MLFRLDVANRRAVSLFLVSLLFLSSGCLGNNTEQDSTDSDDGSKIELIIWSTYEVDSKEEEGFLDSLEIWKDANP